MPAKGTVAVFAAGASLLVLGLHWMTGGPSSSRDDGAFAPDLETEIEFVIPKGATPREVVDTLTARGLVGWRWGFRALARLRGDDLNMKYGRYSVEKGASWGAILDRITRGAVVTVAVTVHEGATLEEMAGALSAVTPEDSAQVARVLTDSALAVSLGSPIPSLEGYLFPDTYRFASGTRIERVISELWKRQNRVWDDSLRAVRLDSLEMSKHEVLTLASIVQAEAARTEEMPRIASVYRNRLEQDWPLEADPTVLYALGGWRPRLLYAAMDSVAGHPYNTYTRSGLPPGPIGAPGEYAIDAVLWPADESFMFFVAGRNGYHEFSRTLAEHNRAIARIRNTEREK